MSYEMEHSSNERRKKTHILGFAGSLRKGSYNKMLLQSAGKLLPEGADLETFDLEGIPPFNQDYEKEPSQRVRDFKSRIKQADAILIATPEYNYSYPGVLKNAIDWASRPRGDNSFDKKPVALVSASSGMLGGVRAQYQLRQAFVFLNMYPVNGPDVLVGRAAEKFDANGNLTDEDAKKFLSQLLQNLVGWTKKLQAAD